MATTLALAMRASMSAGGVVSGANQAAKAMDSMGKHAKQAASDMAVLKNLAIGAAVVKGFSVLAGMFRSASNAITQFVSRVNGTLDALHDLSQRTDISAESLQVFQMAARLAGVDDLTGALSKLAVAIGQAAESGNTEAFTRLGLDFEALRTMSPEDQFRAIQAAIAALPTAAQRAAAAVAIFGRAGVELLPLMNENLAEIEARMKRLGAVVRDDQVAAIDEMNDALVMVRAMFDGIIGQVTANLAPVVTALAEELMRVVEGFNGASGQGGTGIANAITEAMFAGAEYLAGVFDQAMPQLQEFGESMHGVAETFSFVANVFKGVIELFSGYVNAWTAQLHAQTALLIRTVEMIPLLSSEFRQRLKEARQAEESMFQDSASRVGENFSNAGEAFSNAFNGTPAQAPEGGAAAEAVRAMRDKFRESQTPEAQARREADKKKRDAERKAAADAAAAADKAARDAKAAKDKADKEAAAAFKRREDAARKAAAIAEKMASRQEDIDKIQAEKAAALGGKSNESLKANDVRSSEGMAQFIALATGREDPAIEENRKTNRKLEEIRAELRALQQERVDILGAAA